MKTAIEKLREKHNNSKSGFAAVKMLREIRDKLSLEIQDMSHEEERRYLDKLLSEGESKAK